ncbi:hypothetical protein [Microvirga guangxiensis]|uniref:hypothetical protein n=1 Tax=Microvirga guangxiensis TaxID=549386 RepID=UPI000B82A60D|nr:hypothetical protein [Microvirga guangxiensis]
MTEQLNYMHRIFLPASSISEGMRKNVCCFWENQDKVLDAMQAFANGWFERRHTGTRAALGTALRSACARRNRLSICCASMADGLACQRRFMTVARVLGQPAAASVEQETELPQAETGRVHSKAA